MYVTFSFLTFLSLHPPRLLGDVLVERTVSEVLPAVKQNKENIEMLVKQLQQQLEKRKAELAEFQAKYKIRIKGQDDDKKSDSKAGSSSNSQGVLVSKS